MCPLCLASLPQFCSVPSRYRRYLTAVGKSWSAPSPFTPHRHNPHPPLLWSFASLKAVINIGRYYAASRKQVGLTCQHVCLSAHAQWQVFRSFMVWFREIYLISLIHSVTGGVCGRKLTKKLADLPSRLLMIPQGVLVTDEVDWNISRRLEMPTRMLRRKEIQKYLNARGENKKGERDNPHSVAKQWAPHTPRVSIWDFETFWEFPSACHSLLTFSLVVMVYLDFSSSFSSWLSI